MGALTHLREGRPPVGNPYYRPFSGTSKPPPGQNVDAMTHGVRSRPRDWRRNIDAKDWGNSRGGPCRLGLRDARSTSCSDLRRRFHRSGQLPLPAPATPSASASAAGRNNDVPRWECRSGRDRLPASAATAAAAELPPPGRTRIRDMDGQPAQNRLTVSACSR